MNQIDYERKYFSKMTDMELDVYSRMYDNGLMWVPQWGQPMEEVIAEYWQNYFNERP